APGDWNLRVNGEPFYVKGVGYNVSDDWKNGTVTLNRAQLAADFGAIRAMGANTIRRYGSNKSDQNILRLAGKNGLKTVYGFVQEYDVDYLRDQERLEEYVNETEEAVRRWKDEPTILAWGLGNETWAELRVHFGQPYLTEVRHAYVDFIE